MDWSFTKLHKARTNSYSNCPIPLWQSLSLIKPPLFVAIKQQGEASSQDAGFLYINEIKYDYVSRAW